MNLHEHNLAALLISASSVVSVVAKRAPRGF
jgi:hypothetical protein